MVGFGDNDDVIRDLMRFIEMTSWGIVIEDVMHKGGVLNYKK